MDTTAQIKSERKGASTVVLCEGAGPRNMDYPSPNTALITSNRGATRSLRTEWPESPRVVCAPSRC